MPTRSLVSVSLALAASVCIQMGGCLTSDSDGGRDTDKPVTDPQPPAANPPKGDKPSAPKNPDAKRDAADEVLTVSGTLRGGIMGIGGEHTGWQLERDNGLPALEIGVGKVGAATAKKFDGKKVTISGRLIDRKYTERGIVKILRADSIVEARSTRY